MRPSFACAGNLGSQTKAPAITFAKWWRASPRDRSSLKRKAKAMPSNSEFDLHIWKQRASSDGQDRFTIGIGDKGRIMPLCHIEPLERAVAVIRTLLEEAGVGTCDAPVS